MFRLTWITSACLLMTGLGCDRTTTPGGTGPATQAAVIKARCVICVDHELDVDGTTPSSSFKGKTYYFCSEYCKTEFGKDPEKWLARAASAHSQPGA